MSLFAVFYRPFIFAVLLLSYLSVTMTSAPDLPPNSYPATTPTSPTPIISSSSHLDITITIDPYSLPEPVPEQEPETNTMQTTRDPYLKSLSHRGFVQGVTISTTNTSAPLCHFFGGIRYALPPLQRWRRAIQLPSSYSYGTQEDPGNCEGGVGVCPQPGFMGPPDQTGWSEDCFQCNVYVPVGEPPKEGWPVFVFIHGGWLQFGTPNTFSAAALLGETAMKAVVVMPAYRLNVFGFLYSSELQHDAGSVDETTGNHGFWDQRLALEWTKENIPLFGGNAANITVAGYSAGAYSVFHQLSYDLRLPPAQSIIKQACMWSNSPAVQPKLAREAQTQFNQLLTSLQIPHTLSSPEKLALLRSIPAQDLLTAATRVELHQYRPTTDSAFVPPTLFQTLDNGEFAQRLTQRGVRIMLGECRDEPMLYSLWKPPLNNTLQALHTRLCAEYPRAAVDILTPLYYPDNALPPACGNWDADAFGRIYADMQVYRMQRGFIDALVKGGLPEDRLLRYRVEMRVKCADKAIPPAWGVTHSTDQFIWFWGNGEVLEEGEKEVLAEAFIGPLARFVRGEEDVQWGTTGHRQMRTLKPDGRVEVWKDELWDDAVRVWRALREGHDQQARL